MAKLKITTIVTKPTWGKTLALFQEKGSIRIPTSDSETFRKILDAIPLMKYSVEEDPNVEAKHKLTRFILVPAQSPDATTE